MPTENPLPIPDNVGNKPFFQIDELLRREDETGRVDCSFEAIQGYLQSHTRYLIPFRLAAPLARLGRWQLVYPNTFDLSQILFIGKSTDNRGYIPLAEAEATLYFHRGVEGGTFNKPEGLYTRPWKMELASVFPDSSGDLRMLAVYYRLHTEDRDFSSQSMRISIRNDELVGREKESDTVFGPVLNIPAHPHTYPFISLGVGIVTPGMMDLVPDHRRVIVGPFFGRTVLYIDSGVIDRSSPKNNEDFPIDRGMYVTHEEGVWKMGLDVEGTSTPWVLPVPDSLVKPIRSLAQT